MNFADNLSILRLLSSQNFSNFSDLSFNETDIVQTLKELTLEAVADDVFSWTTEVILICLYACVAFVGVSSNLFILSVIMTSKKLLSNPSSVLVANLMFGDIIMCVVCMPFTLIFFIRRSWSFGWIMCKVVPFVQGLSVFLCSSTIAVIAGDRVVRVTGTVLLSNRPPVRRLQLTQIGMETLVIWCLAFMLSLPALICQEQGSVSLSDWGEELGRQEYIRCYENMSPGARLAYAVVILVVQYVVPVLVLFYANYRIKCHLRQSLQQLQHSTNQALASTPVASSGGVTVSLTQGTESSDRRHLLREWSRNRKVIRTLLYLALAFMVTWLPWNITNIYIDLFEPEVGPELSLTLVVFHLIAMTSIPLNAFLYGWSNPTVKVEGYRLQRLLIDGLNKRIGGWSSRHSRRSQQAQQPDEGHPRIQVREVGGDQEDEDRTTTGDSNQLHVSTHLMVGGISPALTSSSLVQQAV